MNRAVSAAAVAILVACSGCARNTGAPWTFHATPITYHCYSKGPDISGLTNAGEAAAWSNADRAYVLHRNRDASLQLQAAVRALSRDRGVRVNSRLQELLAIAQAFARVGNPDRARALWREALILGKAPNDDRTTIVARGNVKQFFTKVIDHDLDDDVANVQPTVRETGAIELEKRALNAAATGNRSSALTLLQRARTCGGAWVGPYPDYALGALYLMEHRSAKAWPHLFEATLAIVAGGDAAKVSPTNLRAAQLLLRFYPEGI